MGFIAAPNVVRLEAIYLQAGEVCENVYHYQLPGTPDALTMNNLIDGFISWETTYGKTARNTFTALIRVRCVDMSVANGMGVDRDVIPSITGTDATAALPNNCTVAIAWRTGLSGRSYRGRTFHIGLAQDQRTGNQITPDFHDGLVTLYSKLELQPLVGLYPLVVLSRRHNNADRAVCVATPVTAVTVNYTLDSQRRRLPEHNRHH